MSDKTAVIDGLSKVLADSYALLLKTQSFHWNVTGGDFYQYHKMFQDQYEALFLAVDEVAERIRALGAEAPGSFTAFGNLASVSADNGARPGTEMIAALIEGHEATMATVRSTARAAGAVDDVVSQDLMAQRLADHEKTVWMLKSTIA